MSPPKLVFYVTVIVFAGVVIFTRDLLYLVRTGTRYGQLDQYDHVVRNKQYMDQANLNILRAKAGLAHDENNIELNLTLRFQVNGGENELRKNFKYVDKTAETSKKETASQGEIKFETPSLLTLITTWSGKGDVNARTHNFTLRNWARLKPEVNPVLFIDDGYDATVAQRLGWKTHRIPKSSINGLPVLKDMFQVVKETYESKFYGYANSDILFTSNLVETLVHVYYDSFYSENTTLVTGMRTNIVNLTEEEFSTQTTLLNAVSTRGQLYMTSAEDYFIYAAEYSWSDMPEFVVGLIAYDNWLVLNSRYREDHVIDASRTVTAAHHTVREPDYQSHFRENAQYNKVLFRKMMQFHVEPPYEKGFTNCIDKFTEFVDKKIEIRSRKLEDPCLF